MKTKDKLYCFNKANVLIIESKDYKITESTKENTINVSEFNEELMRKPKRK